MIDIHTHVIPNVDDGCESIDEAIEMIVKSKTNGVNTIICTPHFILNRFTKSALEIKTEFEKLKEEVKSRNIDVNLLLGQEIYYTEKVDIFKMIEEKKLLTINDSKYVLIEFDFIDKPNDLEEILYEFKVNKLVPIIAHVERYDWITLEDVLIMKANGAKIQINSNSCLKLSGHKKYVFTKKLLKNSLVNFIASDMHSFRPTTLKEACVKWKFTNKNIFESNK